MTLYRIYIGVSKAERPWEALQSDKSGRRYDSSRVRYVCFFERSAKAKI